MPVERLGTRDVDISALTYFPGNPRRGSLPEIRKSVARLGQYRSVVVRDTGTELVILAGLDRLRDVPPCLAQYDASDRVYGHAVAAS